MFPEPRRVPAATTSGQSAAAVEDRAAGDATLGRLLAAMKDLRDNLKHIAPR